MKIGIEATSAAEDQRAGVGNYTYHLLQAMARLRQEEHTFTLYLRSPCSPQNHFPASQQWMQKVLKFRCLWAQIRLPFELWNDSQDVYFFPTSVLPLVYQTANSAVTIHDVAFLFYPECFSPMLRFWLKIATKIGVARAKKVIAVSESTRQDLLIYYNVAPEKVIVVHHGVHEMFRVLADNGPVPAIQTAKQRYGITGKYILCIGTLQQRKNIPRLLHAFHVLKQTYHIPHRLVLIGQRSADLPESEIFSTIDRFVLENDVVWTGYVPQHEMPALLNGAEIFVLPSLYEGFGMPLLEAMACGVPVVCSNTSSFPEVVGEAGVMFDPYDVKSMITAIYQILRNNELRRDLREKGLQRVRAFTWERCARKTLDILESIWYEKGREV